MIYYRYLVDLSCDGVNVVQELLSAGLVAPEYQQEPLEIDVNILVGQQIRVTLGDVISLSEIVAYVDNSSMLQCTLHNLGTATETFEDVLKQWIGHVLIMYVDNVLDKTRLDTI